MTARTSPETRALEVLSALQHPWRWRLVILLMAWDEMCVMDMMQRMDRDKASVPVSAINQPKISHHLAHLKSVGLIESERRGREVHYRLSPMWDKTEDAVSLLLGGKLGLTISRQPWVSTD